MHFIDRRNGIAEPVHDLRRQFEAKIHALWRGCETSGRRAWRERDAAGLDLAERMQFGRARAAEDLVPGVRSNPHHAGQLSLEVAEADGTDQRRQIVAAKRPERCPAVGVGLYSSPPKKPPRSSALESPAAAGEVDRLVLPVLSRGRTPSRCKMEELVLL
jgi:hypothetical protein